MKIVDAKKRVVHLRIAAVVIIVISVLFLFCGGLKGIYFVVSQDNTMTAGISRAVQRIIDFVYERTQFISWVWKTAPAPNLEKLNTPSNYGWVSVSY